MWTSELKQQRKRWCSFYTINCWGSTTRDIGIPARFSLLSWNNPSWLLTSLENVLVMKNAPLWGKPSTSPFEAVLLTTANSRKNSRAVIIRPFTGMQGWVAQIWDTERLWHYYFIFVAEVSILGSLLFLFQLDKLENLFQMLLLLSTPLSHNCLLGHWQDSSLELEFNWNNFICSRGEESSAPFTS